MKYKLRLHPNLPDQVVSFITTHFPDPTQADAAVTEVFRILERITDDPTACGTRAEGPYPGRIGVHRIEVGEVGYYLRIYYWIDEHEGAVEVYILKMQSF